MWHAAARGEAVDWDEVLLATTDAVVDWPGASSRRELTDTYPDALVLSRSVIRTAWYDSAIARRSFQCRSPTRRGRMEEWTTVHPWRGPCSRQPLHPGARRQGRHPRRLRGPLRRRSRHRARRPPPRVDGADGWEPLCAALDIAVPDDPFPRLNTRDDWAPPEDPDEVSDEFTRRGR